MIEIADKMGLAHAKADEYLKNVLINCGKWHLLGLETMRHHAILEELGDKDLITIREHYAERFPTGVKAYELTEKGLDTLEALAGSEVADEAVADRQWYRDQTSRRAWAAECASKSQLN